MKMTSGRCSLIRSQTKGWNRKRDCIWKARHFTVTQSGRHLKDTVPCRYYAVNFLQNPHKQHLIARPLGRDMGWLLWDKTLMDILPQSLKWCMQYMYYVLLDRVITALGCAYKFWNIRALKIQTLNKVLPFSVWVWELFVEFQRLYFEIVPWGLF